MNSPNPALVTQSAVKRLPRLALLLFCAAYVLPGVFGRDPWRNADITAFGYMVSMAEGRSSWLMPTVGGLPSDAALLPYWLGAGFIKLLGPWLGEPLAARLPYALLLVFVLLLTWLSTSLLARTEAAQPLPFAFGGEANPKDYARAVADGAVLALIASLGLLLLGHETTPELFQLAAVSLYLYALSAAPFKHWPSRVAAGIALPALAASGAPAIAVILGITGAVICQRSTLAPARAFVAWILGSTLLAAFAAWWLGAWAWRVGAHSSAEHVLATLKLFAWFTWPSWPLACWTLWRWRRQLTNRHISVPLGCAVVNMLACIAMAGSDRALMLALPSLAVLASFALPTLQRSTSAAIDWFSVFFFSLCALIIWLHYSGMQTGVPAQTAANVARRVSGFVPSFHPVALVSALAGTVAWLWLVKWRTGRHRDALWKSMVLPAGGVALCWLLLMTLWLPLLDHARSYRPLVTRLATHIPKGACVLAPGVSRGQIVALEYFGGWRVDAATPLDRSSCEYLVQLERRDQPQSVPAGAWTFVARERRPSDNEEVTAVYRRGAAP